MPAYRISREKHRRIFGDPDPMDQTGPGRSRRCNVTGQWYKLGQNPHNLPPAEKRNPDLAMPMIAPAFQPFKASIHPDAPVIGSRGDKREFMERNGLTEYESGVRNEAAQWSREHDNRREIEDTIKRFDETDTDYWTPEQRGHVAPTTSLGTGGEDVDLSVVEGSPDAA